MKERRLEEKPACAVKSAPVPTEVTCPHCGTEIEIWSDETDSACTFCGLTVHSQDNHIHEDDYVE